MVEKKKLGRKKSRSHVYTDHDPRHLSKVPEEWEVAQGGLEERVTKVGKNSIQYANLIGVQSSGSTSNFWEQVQIMGQDAMKLMGKEERAAKRGPNHRDAGTSLEERDVKAIEEGDLTQQDGEVMPGVFLDDYETQDWGLEQIESAANTLIFEVEHSQPHSAKQRLGLRMLLKLLDRHKSAVAYCQRNMEDVVNKALPGLLKRRLSPTAFQLAPLLAALAPRLGEDLSRLNAVLRIAKFLTWEMALAARLLQHRIRVKLKRRAEAASGVQYPRDVQIRKQMMDNMLSDDLNEKWRAMHDNPLGGVLSEETATFYLEVLVALTWRGRGEGASRFARQDRVAFAEARGVIPVAHYAARFAQPGRCLALRLLLHLSQEKCLLLPLLDAEVLSRLTTLLAKEDASTPEGLDFICLLLEVLDSVANLAHKFVDINEPGSGAQRRHETGSVVTESTLPSTNTVAEAPDPEAMPGTVDSPKLDAAIRDHLGRPALAAALCARLRPGQDGRVFLGAAMALHKLACTAGYHAVLDEVMAVAGQVLQILVEGLSVQEDFVPHACMVLLIQLTSREEGRMGLTTTGAVGMLRPLCGAPESAHTPTSLMALSVLQALARSGAHASLRPSQLALDAPASSLAARLYEETYLMLAGRPPAEAAASVEYLVAEGGLGPLAAWLLRPDRPAHYFDLPRGQTHLAAVVLHRLCTNDAACAELLGGPAPRFLCHVVQNNHTALAEGDYARLRGRARERFWQSTQAACRALGCLALVDTPLIPHDRARRRVFEELTGTCALDEVARLMAIPAVRETPGYADREATAAAAAVLISAVCPLPAAEAAAALHLESRVTERESAKACLPDLERLVKQCATNLISLVQLTDSVELLRAACMALAKLASTNETCALLLQKGAVKALGRLVPRGRPTEVPEEEDDGDGDAVVAAAAAVGADDDPAAAPFRPTAVGARALAAAADPAGLRRLLALPAAFYRLLAALARLPEGQRPLLALGLLKRSLERVRLRPEALPAAQNHAALAEIALFLSRVANTYNEESGSANDHILNPRYRAVPCLVALAARGPTFRGKYNAMACLAAITEDTMRAVPPAVAAGALAPTLAALRDPASPQGLLRRALEVVRNVANYPNARYHAELLGRHRAQAALVHIASNLTLELDFGGVADRESLGDIARDCLETLTLRRRHHRPGPDPAGPLPPQQDHAAAAAAAAAAAPSGKKGAPAHLAQTAPAGVGGRRAGGGASGGAGEEEEGEEAAGVGPPPRGGSRGAAATAPAGLQRSPLPASAGAAGADGTYLSCGVSHCGSLRYKGATAAAAPPTPGGEVRGGGGGEEESGAGHGRLVLPDVHDNKRGGLALAETMAGARRTSVGNLSARSPALRREIRRRKEVNGAGIFDEEYGGEAAAGGGRRRHRRRRGGGGKKGGDGPRRSAEERGGGDSGLLYASASSGALAGSGGRQKGVGARGGGGQGGGEGGGERASMSRPPPEWGGGAAAWGGAAAPAAAAVEVFSVRECPALALTRPPAPRPKKGTGKPSPAAAAFLGGIDSSDSDRQTPAAHRKSVNDMEEEESSLVREDNFLYS